MQFQSANGLHILNFNRGEGNRTSPSSPGMCAPGDQLCPHCQWCMQEMLGASLGSPQDGNSLLRLVLHGPGSGAKWRLLVGGKRQVLAAVRPTSHCSATSDGGITHRQMKWPATVLPKRFLEPVSESISTETLTLRKRLYVIGN